MLNRKLLPVGRSQVLAQFRCFRECLGSQTSESAIQDALSSVKPFGGRGRPSFIGTKKLLEWAQKRTEHDAVISHADVHNFCNECKKDDAMERERDVSSMRPVSHWYYHTQTPLQIFTPGHLCSPAHQCFSRTVKHTHTQHHAHIHTHIRTRTYGTICMYEQAPA